MSDYSLTKTRFLEGTWEGLVSAARADAPTPEIVVTLHDCPLRGVTLSETTSPGRWALQVPVPAQALGDGVMTFLITEARSEALLDSFTVIAGEALAEDIRAEVELLRAELDLLKRAFRRHCLETR
jgi:hypothetical protein